jgi:hypothetical protein
LANKRYYADNNKYISKNDKLVQLSSLVSAKIKSDLRDLIIDRDHVAHGRPPYLLGRRQTIERYLEVGLEIVQAYLGQIKKDEWPNLSKLTLASSRR